MRYNSKFLVKYEGMEVSREDNNIKSIEYCGKCALLECQCFKIMISKGSENLIKILPLGIAQ